MMGKRKPDTCPACDSHVDCECIRLDVGGNTHFMTGAIRSELTDVRYDLISPYGRRRLAMTCAEGAKKYGDHNWRKGMPFSTILNHVMEHLTLYHAGAEGGGLCQGEDHLAHAAWGLFAMMEFEETMPGMNDLFDYGDEVNLS